MNEGRFIAGVRFVVDAVCAHIEKLPIIDVSPETDSEPLPKGKNLSQEGCGQILPRENIFPRYSQQGVKRSCGQSQKSVRVESAKISPLKHK